MPAEGQPAIDGRVFARSRCSRAKLTILDEDGQALLDQKCGIKDDQAEAQRQHVVTRSDLQEVSDSLLNPTTTDTPSAFMYIK